MLFLISKAENVWVKKKSRSFFQGHRAGGWNIGVDKSFISTIFCDFFLTDASNFQEKAVPSVKQDRPDGFLLKRTLIYTNFCDNACVVMKTLYPFSFFYLYGQEALYSLFFARCPWTHRNEFSLFLIFTFCEIRR